MTKDNIKAKKGFTIIEVVLVLAIAGLIFLMVFVALPALQRSQRDTARRDDMARFISQLAQFQANNKNKVPDNNTTGKTWDGFIASYLNTGGDEFADPDGTDYQIQICGSASGTPTGDCALDGNNLTWDNNKHTIYVFTNARCDGETVVPVANAPYQVAIHYKLEGAGVYCGNN